MRKLVLMFLLLMLLCPAALAGGESAASETPGADSLYGTYAFEKQLYMNPLSSFMAFDGFEEYYELREDAFSIIEPSGLRRTWQITWSTELFDPQAFQSSFMMEGFGIPDVSAYANRYQYNLTSSPPEAIAYRVYTMEDEVWLVQIRQDSANVKKQVYIWSIFKIQRYDGEMPSETVPAE